MSLLGLWYPFKTGLFLQLLFLESAVFDLVFRIGIWGVEIEQRKFIAFEDLYKRAFISLSAHSALGLNVVRHWLDEIGNDAMESSDFLCLFVEELKINSSNEAVC